VRAERTLEHRVTANGASVTRVPGAPVSVFDPGGLRGLLATDDRTTYWAAALAAAVVGFAGLYLSGVLNIWIDEAFTLRTTDAGPIAAWSRSIAFEVQPPVYFIIEALWRTIDEASIIFARLPSVLFAAGAAAVIVLAAHRIAPRVPPPVVALLTALNPVFFWTASEMRVYALVLLFGAVLTWLFFEGFLVAPAARRAQIWYTVFALAGLYTQYYVGFVLAVHLLTLLALRRGTLRAFFASMAVVALGFAPFVRVALSHVAASGSFVSRATFGHAAHEVANVVFAFVLPHEVDWSGAAKVAGFVVSAALLAGVCVLGRPNLRGNPTAGIVLQWVLCLAVFAVLFGFSGVPVDPIRHLVIMAPSSVLITCVLLSSLTRERTRAIAVTAAVFAVFAAGTLWSSYRPPLAKKGDWQRVAAMLAQADPATPIAIFPAELALPLDVYLSKPVIPIPRAMPYSSDYVRATTLRDEADVARALDPVRAMASRLWLVTGVVCGNPKLNGYDYNCRFLEAYMEHRYRMVESIAFRGTVARLYERGSAARIDLPPSRHAN
jgi:hypothetical protein